MYGKRKAGGMGTKKKINKNDFSKVFIPMDNLQNPGMLVSSLQNGLPMRVLLDNMEKPAAVVMDYGYYLKLEHLIKGEENGQKERAQDGS